MLRVLLMNGDSSLLRLDLNITILEIREIDFKVEVDETTMRCKNYPKNPETGEAYRPNILLFYDNSWLSERTPRVTHYQWESLRLDHFSVYA